MTLTIDKLNWVKYQLHRKSTHFNWNHKLMSLCGLCVNIKHCYKVWHCLKKNWEHKIVLKFQIVWILFCSTTSNYSENKKSICFNCRNHYRFHARNFLSFSTAIPMMSMNRFYSLQNYMDFWRNVNVTVRIKDCFSSETHTLKFMKRARRKLFI